MTVLLLPGSTRAGSTNTAVLRTAHEMDPDTILYDGLSELPAFNPDDDRTPLPAPVEHLRSALGACTGVLICTPEYAGALPGSFKNLLDWTVGGMEMYEMPVGWLNVASPAAPTGGAASHAELATVLGYVNARIIGSACRRVPLTRSDVDSDGLVPARHLRDELGLALAALNAAVDDTSVDEPA